jgi:uncharacterized membrane protein
MGTFTNFQLDKKEWLLITVAFISVVAAIIFYPSMPARMVTHWGAGGVPNGYMNAFWGSFIMPIVLVFVVALIIVLPRADPLRKNIDTFKDYFLNFSLILVIMMYALQIYVILWNLGYDVNILYFVIPLMTALFYYMGIMLSNAKQNMTIGIRTPWTLKSEKVWDKTHQRIGHLTKIASVIFLFGLIFPRQAFLFVVVPIVLVFLYSMFYSYALYEQGRK